MLLTPLTILIIFFLFITSSWNCIIIGWNCFSTNVNFVKANSLLLLKSWRIVFSMVIIERELFIILQSFSSIDFFFFCHLFYFSLLFWLPEHETIKIELLYTNTITAIWRFLGNRSKNWVYFFFRIYMSGLYFEK